MRHLFIFSIILTAIAAAPALATDSLIEGAKLCTRHLPAAEKRYGIPNNLLAAISSTESGRWHNQLNIALPWPWTINVEGQGYYFDSKQEAIDAVRKFQARGIASIDVGCMQVNLMHHAKAFASLSEAFDPPANIDYAARFLRSNYDEEHSWRKAAADYHSRTPSLGSEYVGQVHKAWQRIVDRIRGIKGNYVATDYTSPGADTSSSGKLLKRDRETGKMLPRQTTPHEYSLSVHNSPAERAREGGVMVIRPAVIQAQPEQAAALVNNAAGQTATAMANEAAAASNNTDPAAAAVPPAAATTTETIIQPKILSVGRSPSRSPARSGPHFIFD